MWMQSTNRYIFLGSAGESWRTTRSLAPPRTKQENPARKPGFSCFEIAARRQKWIPHRRISHVRGQVVNIS